MFYVDFNNFSHSAVTNIKTESHIK